VTTEQLLFETVNSVLRRPIVNGAELRRKLIEKGVIKAGRWVYVNPNGNRRGARLEWQTTHTS
jgi:hypothetical protein